ncbi:hypothetical protein [Serratia liquefaciens]|uniref:hypothetical protein n=1 Tax=Serratia liquefaciens TaxID=614 RepID=UPI0013EAD0E1|nr:hypothetical protein [Serratia liquefaciens]
MANSWLRLWHDMPNDPKWRTIAKVSGQPIALVQAVYLQLLVSASQNPVTDETGVTSHIVTVTNEDISSALDVTEGDVARVTSAMQGRVLSGNTISGWDKRQALFTGVRNNGKPPMTGAERTKACRDRKKQKELEKRNVTTSNVTETLGNDVTPQIREEEIREEVKEKPKTTLSGAEKNQPQTSESIPPEEIFISLPLTGGAMYPVSMKYIESRGELYPAVNIHQELRNMFGWLESNPTKRKTPNGIKRFITTWLQKCQDNPRSRQVTYGQNVSGNGESIAERQLREGREQWLREQHNGGLSGVAVVGPHDQNLQQPVDCEEWQSTIGPLGTADWGDDQ